MDTLGNRIRIARANMSQATFAKALDVSKGSLGFYERNENLPNSDVVIKICSMTGVNLEWLLLGKGPMKPGGAVTESASPCADGGVVDTTTGCKRCLELYGKLDTANERLYKAMQENGELKEVITELKERIVELNIKIEELKKEPITLEDDTRLASAS